MPAFESKSRKIPLSVERDQAESASATMPGDVDPSALDLAFLSRQTFGDRALEREILILFDAQCARLLPIVLGNDDRQVRADAAHTLTGAAGAVGAGQVAALSAAIEAGLLEQGAAIPDPRHAEESCRAARLAARTDLGASFEMPASKAPQDDAGGGTSHPRPGSQSDLTLAVEAARRAVAARLRDV